MTYTAPGPPPCRAMRRNPLVFGLSGASLAAIAAPGWDVLISLWASPLGSFGASPELAAPGSAAAVLALVASPVRHHQHAALGASRRTLVRVARLGRRRNGDRRRQAQRLRTHRRCRYVCVQRCCLISVQLQIVRRNKAPAKPPRDIVQYRRHKANVRIRRDPRWLKSRV